MIHWALSPNHDYWATPVLSTVTPGLCLSPGIGSLPLSKLDCSLSCSEDLGHMICTPDG